MRTNNIVNYADDTTPYSCANDIPTAISELQAQQKKGLLKFFKFFKHLEKYLYRNSF